MKEQFCRRLAGSMNRLSMLPLMDFSISRSRRELRRGANTEGGWFDARQVSEMV